jgi:hypothetical protein
MLASHLDIYIIADYTWYRILNNVAASGDMTCFDLIPEHILAEEKDVVDAIASGNHAMVKAIVDRTDFSLTLSRTRVTPPTEDNICDLIEGMKNRDDPAILRILLGAYKKPVTQRMVTCAYEEGCPLCGAWLETVIDTTVSID